MPDKAKLYEYMQGSAEKFIDWQDTLREWDKIKFICHHSPPYGLNTSSVGVAVLWFHSSKISEVDMTSLYVLICLWTFQPTLVYTNA